MVQLLGAFAALTESLGLVPITHMYATPIPEDLTPSSGFCRYCMYIVQFHTCKLFECIFIYEALYFYLITINNIKKI